MIFRCILCFLSFLLPINGKEITNYWSGHKVLPPIVHSINVTSIPSCMHRCNIHNKCNIVGVSKYPSPVGFTCLLAWMECYERYNERIVLASYWDVYAMRANGSLPFLLMYRSSSVQKCTKIDQSEILVLSNYCYDLFCKNSLDQIVYIATRNCLSLSNQQASGAYVSISTTYNETSVFREVYRGVQQVTTTWHIHPERFHENPPKGTKVAVWISETYWFYFDYKEISSNIKEKIGAHIN